MARRPASGRGLTDDCRATGKSFRDPVEAWWKHEGENRCAILTIRAQATHSDPARNRRKPRNNSRSRAIVHGLFDTTHNLKVTGSNPVPATKKQSVIKRLRAALRGGVCVCAHRGSTVEARGHEVLQNKAKIRLARLGCNRSQKQRCVQEPWQQVVDLGHLVARGAGEGFGEPGMGIDRVEFGHFNKGVAGDGGIAAGLRADEEVVCARGQSRA